MLSNNGDLNKQIIVFSWLDCIETFKPPSTISTHNDQLKPLKYDVYASSFPLI
mgnify:FL=1